MKQICRNVDELPAEVSPGTNVIPVIMKDYSGNERTSQWQVVVPSGETKTLTYDNNGNLISVSSANPVPPGAGSVVNYSWTRLTVR